MNETKANEEQFQEWLLGEYRQAVRSMLDSSVFNRIENSSPKHAAIIIEEMIGHAQHSFCAIAQTLNPVVWSPRVISALTSAMSNGIKVSLLVVAAGDLVHLDSIPAELRSRVRRAERPDVINFNFAVMDDKAVRLEYDIANDKASFCVNENELAHLAQAKFEQLYEAGKTI